MINSLVLPSCRDDSICLVHLKMRLSVPDYSTFPLLSSLNGTVGSVNVSRHMFSTRDGNLSCFFPKITLVMGASDLPSPFLPFFTETYGESLKVDADAPQILPSHPFRTGVKSPPRNRLCLLHSQVPMEIPYPQL